MKKGLFVCSICLLSTFLLAGCTQSNAAAASIPENNAAAYTESDSTLQQQDLGAAVDLVGKADADAMDLFGGGEENRTEGQGTFIGRIYQTELYGEPVTIYTACGEDRAVDAVSVWVTDGTQTVADEQVQAWQEHVSAFTGVEMQEMDASEESDMQSWRWWTDDMVYTLRLLDNTLTLDINPAVGELN